MKLPDQNVQELSRPRLLLIGKTFFHVQNLLNLYQLKTNETLLTIAKIIKKGSIHLKYKK